MNKYLLLICFIYVFNVNHLCQSEDKYFLYNSHPINLLPPNIPLIKDRVYLWADTTKIEENTIQVLIINNTANELKFNGYQLARIQPEYKINSDNWFRFVPFFYGWCGTAFADDITIHSKEFYVSKESFRTGIVKSEIRFTFYGNDMENSNSFLAKIDTSEAELAKYDDIAYLYCDSEYLINVIKKMPKPYKEIPKREKSLLSLNRDSLFIKMFNDGVVYNAMFTLKKRFPEIAKEILEPIANDETHPYYQSARRIINIKNK
jgi:hypothetical protein